MATNHCAILAPILPSYKVAIQHAVPYLHQLSIRLCPLYHQMMQLRKQPFRQSVQTRYCQLLNICWENDQNLIFVGKRIRSQYLLGKLSELNIFWENDHISIFLGKMIRTRYVLGKWSNPWERLVEMKIIPEIDCCSIVILQIFLPFFHFQILSDTKFRGQLNQLNWFVKKSWTLLEIRSIYHKRSWW